MYRDIIVVVDNFIVPSQCIDILLLLLTTSECRVNVSRYSSHCEQNISIMISSELVLYRHATT